MARQKNWSYNSYDEDEDISIIGNYIWDTGSLAWIKQTAAASGGGGPVTIADGADVAEGSVADAAWVSGNGTVISLLKKIASSGASAGLTDAQLRAAPVPVSGPLTDLQLRASAVAISGTVSISGTVPVSGPLTDAQLRAVPVPVSGTVTTGGLTDVQLRATPVPVDTELPAASALSDLMGNPTTPLIGAALMGWDGGNWHRVLDNGFGIDVHLDAGSANPVTANQGPSGGNSFAWEVALTNSDKSAKLITTGDRLHVDGSGVTQPISGTVNQGTSSANDWRVDFRRGQTVLFGVIDTAASGFTTLVAADATKKIKILSYAFVCGGTVDVYLAAAAAKLTGSMPFIANTGIASPVATPAGGHLTETPVNTAFRINLSDAVQVSGHFSYFLEV